MALSSAPVGAQRVFALDRWNYEADRLVCRWQVSSAASREFGWRGWQLHRSGPDDWLLAVASDEDGLKLERLNDRGAFRVLYYAKHHASVRVALRKEFGPSYNSLIHARWWAEWKEAQL